MTKIDLTGYGDDELSLMVFNDEYLYAERHGDNLVGLLEDYKFTDTQMSVLKEDLESDLEEISV